MSDQNERIAVLEQKIEFVVTRTEDQDHKIDNLSQDLVKGLDNQQNLLREMVGELKGQQHEMQIAYERMGAFTKGVLWIGGTGMALAAFLLRYGDKIKSFFL